jgi:hypothetical protein
MRRCRRRRLSVDMFYRAVGWMVLKDVIRTVKNPDAKPRSGKPRNFRRRLKRAVRKLVLLDMQEASNGSHAVKIGAWVVS